VQHQSNQAQSSTDKMKQFVMVFFLVLLLNAVANRNDQFSQQNNHQAFKFDKLSDKYHTASSGIVKRTLKEHAKLDRSDIIKTQSAPKNMIHKVIFSTKIRNTELLEFKLLDISNPLSVNYGKHFKLERKFQS
jgi:hypothetical protein